MSDTPNKALLCTPDFLKAAAEIYQGGTEDSDVQFIPALIHDATQAQSLKAENAELQERVESVTRENAVLHDAILGTICDPTSAALSTYAIGSLQAARDIGKPNEAKQYALVCAKSLLASNEKFVEMQSALTAERQAREKVEADLMQLLNDLCADETAIKDSARQVLGDAVDGDPHSVPSARDIVEMLVRELAEARAKLASIQLIHQAFSPGSEGRDQAYGDLEFRSRNTIDETRSVLMEAQREMPRYKCHKTVWALKISALTDTSQPDEETDGSLLLTPVEEGYAPFRVDREYVRKHRPVVGGYFVQYEDGYKSFSPAKAFEDGYIKL